MISRTCLLLIACCSLLSIGPPALAARMHTPALFRINVAPLCHRIPEAWFCRALMRQTGPETAGRD